MSAQSEPSLNLIDWPPGPIGLTLGLSNDGAVWVMQGVRKKESHRNGALSSISGLSNVPDWGYWPLEVCRPRIKL
jgi:hypothetical protein